MVKASQLRTFLSIKTYWLYDIVPSEQINSFLKCCKLYLYSFFFTHYVIKYHIPKVNEKRQEDCRRMEEAGREII